MFFLIGADVFASVLDGPNTEKAYSIILASDSGYVVTGYTSSYGVGGGDLLIFKLSPTGTLQWAKVYGGSSSEQGNSIVQTSDGGYLAAGYTTTYGAGSSDILLTKVSSDGSLQWARTFGTSIRDVPYSLGLTSDGGYVVAGYNGNYWVGSADIMVAKFSSTGSVQWARVMRRSGDDYAYSVIQTSDGGYVTAGSIAIGGREYVIVLKLSPFGSLQWARFFRAGEPREHSRVYSVTQASDGDYVVAGYTEVASAGGSDILVMKISPSGALRWAKAFGSAGDDVARSIIQTPDGGYVIAGFTNSSGAGSFDFIILKISPSGAFQWAETFGGTGLDEALTLVPFSDGYALTGFGAYDTTTSIPVLLVNGTGRYPGCVQECSLQVNTPSFSVRSLTSLSSLSLSSSTPSLAVTNITPDYRMVCDPLWQSVGEAPSAPALFSPSPGGLVFQGSEPTQYRLYAPDGRLAKEGTVRPGELVRLKPGVYVWQAGEERGKAAVR